MDAVAGQGMRGFRWSRLWLLVWMCVGSGWPVSGQVVPGQVREVSALAYDSAGNLFFADAQRHQVLEATLAGTLRVVAGTGVQGFAGDGGAATAAELNEPRGVAVGSDGTLYVADTGNHRVRAVSPAGTIATVAGTGAPIFAGDGGAAQAAGLRRPTALALDPGGALLLCDTGNHRVRRVSKGVIATVAGTGVEGFAGEGGAAVLAQLDGPSGVMVAPDGRVFVADTRNSRVRVIDGSGVMRTVAGTGVRGFSGDGGPAVAAELSDPQGLALTSAGELLVADAGNQRVRLVNRAGAISTLAGNGTEGNGADGMRSLAMGMRAPRSVAVSPFGWPAVADALNGTVRAVTGVGEVFQPAALAAPRATVVGGATAATQSYGQGTLAVSVRGVAGVAQGQVQVIDNGVLVETGGLSGGAVSLELGGLGAGAHQLTVKYLGDGLNPASSSAGSFVRVDPVALVAVADPVSAIYGAAVPAMTGTATGVLSRDAGLVELTFGVSAGGLPAVGTYPIVASVAGARAGNYAVRMGAASGQLSVVRAGTVPGLGGVGPAFGGVPLTLTANVRSSTSGEPTGTVQFLDGGTVVGTAVLRAGQASGVYVTPPVGSRALSVQYLGDGNFLPSASAAVLTAVAALPDFRVGSSGSLAASVTAGGTATYVLSVSAQPGPFTGAISLSAAGLPAGASVSFSPPQVVPGTGSAAVTVSVQTAAVAAGVRPGTLTVAFAGICGFGFAWRRRRGGAVWLLGAALLLTGCGARTLGESTKGVLAQTYTLQVTGTGTNLAGAVVTHSTDLTLTVQP